MLIDPENLQSLYNFACSQAARLDDADGALDKLESFFERAPPSFLSWAKVDPDLRSERQTPRFIAMLALAEARLANADGAL
jgi:hypothetical protein